ncbi:MAG: hypothetical protein ABI823_16940, partial [Bryobacteraceae bacterium]
MSFSTSLRLAVWSAVFAAAALSQSPAAPQPAGVANDNKGLPPRTAPTDYQAHAAAGSLTVAAEFAGHSLAVSPDKILTTEEYVVVELALFGPLGARQTLALSEFALRINGKKPIQAELYNLVVPSLRDPDWEPPVAAEGKGSKTSFGSSGKGAKSDGPPAPIKIPI